MSSIFYDIAFCPSVQNISGSQVTTSPPGMPAIILPSNYQSGNCPSNVPISLGQFGDNNINVCATLTPSICPVIPNTLATIDYTPSEKANPSVLGPVGYGRCSNDTASGGVSTCYVVGRCSWPVQTFNTIQNVNAFVNSGRPGSFTFPGAPAGCTNFDTEVNNKAYADTLYGPNGILQHFCSLNVEGAANCGNGAAKCSNFNSNAGSEVCQGWTTQTDRQITQAWSTSMKNYCNANPDALECGCLSRKISSQPTSVIYNQLAAAIAPTVNDACWFEPCRPGGNLANPYLITEDFVNAPCPTTICENINNYINDQNININNVQQYVTCSLSNNNNTTNINYWWIIAIIGIILFLIIILLLVHASRRKDL